MREKLIELLSQVQYLGGLEEKVADHLIASGVTLKSHDCHWATEQAYKNGYEKGKADALKWIPVTERLPKHFEHVLLNIPGEKPFNTVHEGYLEKDGMWNIRMYRCEPEDITHWMPLPEHPKGE